MSGPLETPLSTLAHECCVCHSPINILGAQALSLDLGDGKTARVYFHPICGSMNKKLVSDCLYELADKMKK